MFVLTKFTNLSLLSLAFSRFLCFFWSCFLFSHTYHLFFNAFALKKGKKDISLSAPICIERNSSL